VVKRWGAYCTIVPGAERIRSTKRRYHVVISVPLARIDVRRFSRENKPSHTIMDPSLEEAQGLRIAVEGCVSLRWLFVIIDLTFDLGPWYSGRNICLGGEGLQSPRLGWG
jgi:hypothetical protein